MNGIDWVLFDLGGVLLEVVQARIFNRLHELSKVPAHTIEAWLKGAPFFRDAFMVEELTPQQVTTHINALLSVKLHEADVVAAINAELGAEISSTVELLPGLQRVTQVGCLSNTNSIHWDKLLKSYPFMQRFDRRFASQILGCAKPGREIYEKVAQNLGVPGQGILFFDDKAENVEAAQRLGWHARLYTDHEKLIGDLKEYRLV